MKLYVNTILNLNKDHYFSSVFAHLLSGIYLFDSSDFSYCAFIGDYDIRTTAVVHQCYAGESKEETKAEKQLKSDDAEILCWFMGSLYWL